MTVEEKKERIKFLYNWIKTKNKYLWVVEKWLIKWSNIKENSIFTNYDLKIINEPFNSYDEKYINKINKVLINSKVWD